MCASNLCENLTIQISAGISDPGIEGTLSFSHLDAKPIIDCFFPGVIPIGSSAINGELTFTADEAGAFHASLLSTIRQLTLKGAEAQQVIKGTLNKLSLEADARSTRVSFSAQFVHPQLEAAAKAAIDNKSREITLEVDGKNIDLASCRDVLHAAAGSQPLVRDINARLKGGTISDLFLKAQGPFNSSLMENKNATLKACFSEGGILLPEAGLALQEVNGELTMQDGMLGVKNLAARCENSRAYGATLRFDPGRQYKPVLIETMFTADLSQLPTLVRLIPASDLKNELALIASPRGTAGGRFRLSEEKGSYRTEVDISGLNLKAGYRTFPEPLELRRGTCIYQDGELAFRELTGRLGSSEIPDVSASFSLRDDQRFAITSKGSTIALDDLLPVLNSFAATKDLMRDITTANGSLVLKKFDLNGPLLSPEQWKFTVRAAVQDVSLAAGVLNGPAKIKSALVQADQNQFSLSEARTALMDSSLEGSLTLDSYLRGIQKASASVRGSLGPKSLERITQYINFPAELMPRAPLSVAKSRITWTRTGATEFSGDFSRGTGLKVSLELRSDPQALEIKKLKISGENAESVLRLSIKEDWVDVAYTGAIDRGTLDLLLANNQFVRGWIKGDLNAQMDQKNPLKSTATGTLAWKDVQYPGIENLPVQIKSASIEAAGNSLQVKALDAVVGKCDLHAGGSVKFSQQGYVVDMNVASDSINLDALEKALTKGAAPASAEELWETPLRGRIRVAARSLSKAGLTWEPFNADVMFADKAITIAATEAKLCDISTPGTLMVTPDTMTLEVKPAAQKAAVKTVVKCLTGEKSIITGTLDVQSDLIAQGSTFNLADNLAGKISITARKGRIYRSNLLTRILSFLSIRNLVTGGTTDIARKGFAYRSINIKGEIKGDTLKIDEGILDSATLSLAWQGSIDMATKKMDITVLATPFQLSDLLLMGIPVVGIVFSRTLIGIPLRVTGTIDDP
ncbi:MAG: AsmA-like C-terminal domain-containing protein, partial [Proteobacteria bacterium]|nr:AsmA-like C-terminal domain-containing protein [Pseudomonadota bacterium]